jgi:mono/diheme cytochrome c family protein
MMPHRKKHEKDATLYHQNQMRTRTLLTSLAVLTLAFALIGAVAAALAGCRSLPASKPEALWTIEEARGAQVFHQACAKCHYPTTTKGLKGPGLQAITKVKAMPSGSPPTDERITYLIVHGRGMMPATQLTNDQLSDLLAYLHAL